jgi:hypothetical protein
MRPQVLAPPPALSWKKRLKGGVGGNANVYHRSATYAVIRPGILMEAHFHTPYRLYRKGLLSVAVSSKEFFSNNTMEVCPLQGEGTQPPSLLLTPKNQEV